MIGDNARVRRAGTATPTYATRWVAQRLGISTATLRTWHYRYGLAPTGRTPGGHRRYSGADLGRLEAMCRLIQSGVPAAEAARLSHADRPAAAATRPRETPAGGPRTGVATRDARRLRTELTAAATALDAERVDRALADALRAYGVVPTWTDVLVPVFQRLGERFADGPDCIPAEHVLSERTRTALSVLVARRRSGSGAPVLLVAVDQEQHLLPLNALAAALAEQRRRSVLLGAVPPAALAAAVTALEPAGLFVWAHVRPGRRGALRALDEGPVVPVVVVGGPGWAGRPPDPALHADSLADAVDKLHGTPAG